MIHSNGLGQAIAFLKAKGINKELNKTDDKKISYNALYQIISKWLCQKPQVYAGCENILEGITTKDIQDYQLAQVETLILMSWVKKFAKAFLISEESQP
jgi:CRISPR-associated protein Cmr5